MKAAVGNNTFSAHGGMRDIVRGAVPVQRNRPQEQVKKQPKDRTGFLLIVLSLATLLLLVQNSHQIAEFLSKPVQTVLMQNSLQRVDEGNVRAVLAVHLEAGFFALDVQAIKAELEADAWIEQATITRIWPDTLSVAITEEVAIARWGDSSLVNQYGEVFEPNSIADDLALPLLNGPDGMQRRMMEQYQTFSQMLFASGLRVRELELNERGSWTLRLHNDALVTIGRNDVIEKMQRLVTLYDKYLFSQAEQIEAYDLRYSSGISIRKKDEAVGKVAVK